MKTGFVVAAALIFVVLVGYLTPAAALTLEDATASCKNSVGRPLVVACMGGRARRRSGARNLPYQGHAAVRACVLAALNKSQWTRQCAAPVECRRTEERPDAHRQCIASRFRRAAAHHRRHRRDPRQREARSATLAKLKEDADDEPDAGTSRADLAEFYYDRGNARALLGRFKDALADGEKSLAAGRGAADEMFQYRVQQFIGLQKQYSGDLKGTLQAFSKWFATRIRPRR